MRRGGRRKKRMAAQRAWAWDFEEMRSAGALLDDHDGTCATEYDFGYCQYTLRQLVLNITPGILHQPNLCLSQALPRSTRRDIPQESRIFMTIADLDLRIGNLGSKYLLGGAKRSLLPVYQPRSHVKY